MEEASREKCKHGTADGNSERKLFAVLQGWKDPPPAFLRRLLPEDYVTCIAEGDGGTLWVGFRQQGLVELDSNHKQLYRATNKGGGIPIDYVFSILPTPMLQSVATYGGGVAFRRTGMIAERKEAEEEKIAFPTAAKIASGSELSEATRVGQRKLAAVCLADDWKTQGNFYGEDKLKNYRYGEWHGHLCAFCSPFDAVWGRKAVACAGRLGTNRTKDDSLRHWVHWSRTDNVRSLKNPALGGRRQSEWDDHGEAYPMTHEGPSIYINIDMPDSPCYLSLYFFNKDGHDGHNRFRDFVVTVKEFAPTDAAFAKAPVLARGRVVTFWGGVYKRFAVKGGRKYTVEIHDNWSFNTIVSGVFVDPIVDSEEEREYESYVPRVHHSLLSKDILELGKLAPDGDASAQALRLVARQQEMRVKSPLQFAQQSRHAAILALQALQDPENREVSKEVMARVKADCFHRATLFDERDAIYRKLDEPK